ncbi:MAG TPA: hypothetical protein VGR00_02480 [Thermoanaerobaculia bacterium]|jgi:subtilisin-like proprotein convertase family protein|nr:hypothetical protein [Thermoanaerobaculia bacterium]
MTTRARILALLAVAATPAVVRAAPPDVSPPRLSFTSPGGALNDAIDPGSGAHIPAVTNFNIPVTVADPNFVVGDVDVTVNLTHPALAELQLVLSSSTMVNTNLLRNKINSSGTVFPNQGATGTNLVGTIFDQEATASILNNTGGAASTGRFRPDNGLLSLFYGLTAAQTTGTWKVAVTDFRNGNTGSLSNATITFTSSIANPVEGGAAVSGVVALFTDSDPGVMPSNYMALIDWGDGFSSTGVVHAAGASGAFDVTGSHSYAEEGTKTVTVTVHDVADNVNAMTSYSLIVRDAPLSASGVTINQACRLVSGVVATFTDANTSAPVGDFTSTIGWGDLSSSAGNVSAVGPPGSFQVTGSHLYASAGNYILSITIDDVGGSTASASSTANLTPDNVQPVVTPPSASVIPQTVCQ